METMIPADDPVRLLNAFVEGMDLSELYATYDRIRKNQATPRQMLKIMLYASMNRLFSSRDIETACKRDVNFMYLLEGMPAPDHATIARFISLHLSSCPKKILTNVTSILHDLGEISGKTIFIDGTKIESCANKYTFVWKKSVTKHQARLFEKIVSFSYLWKEEQLFQDRSGCDIHAPERRCHAEGAAEAVIGRVRCRNPLKRWKDISVS